MGPGLTIDPARVTADTQLLADPTPRRFLSSLWELRGSELAVTPTVARELATTVAGAEERHWQAVLQHDLQQGNRRYDDGTYRAILNGTRAAATAWISRELEHPGGLTAVQRTSGADRRALEIAKAMPTICFAAASEESEENDRRIVGEAAAYGFRLLASENPGSIRHDHVNEWLEAEGHTGGPLIVRLHEAIPVRGRGASSRDETALQAVLGAALPTAAGEPEADRQAIERFVHVLQQGHARQCGLWARTALEAAEDLDKRIQAARAALPRHTRDAEDRRRGATAAAARKAGYGGR